ncbi:alpha/beta fold hydrolase [Candidatus Bipolaricaulota bacterium]
MSEMKALDAYWRNRALTYDWISLGGLRVREVSCGQGDALLFLHGFAGSLDDWLPIMKRLSVSYRCTAFEFPGSGLSMDLPERYSLGFLVNLVKEYVAVKGLKRLSIIGLSLGAGVGIAAAPGLATNLQSTVLVNPALLGRKLNVFIRICTLPLVGEILLWPNAATVKRYLRLCKAPGNEFPEDWVELRQELAMYPGARTGVLSMLRSGITLAGVKRGIRDETRRALEKIAVPTLVIYGEQDRFLPHEYAISASNVIRNARCIAFPDGGHTLPLEATEQLGGAIEEFLKSLTVE